MTNFDLSSRKHNDYLISHGSAEIIATLGSEYAHSTQRNLGPVVNYCTSIETICLRSAKRNSVKNLKNVEWPHLVGILLRQLQA